MRKEIICYVTTNEKGEEVSVQRVSEDTDFVLIRAGQTRLVLNKLELMEALDVTAFYGRMFDEEQKQKDNKVKLEESRKKAASKRVADDEEGAIVMDVENRLGPTDSELALLKLTANMVGDEIVIKENNNE
jgi:hypothetical protein